MKTERGIYLDIKESDYYFCVDDLTFYFSSQFYLEKFKNNVFDYIQNETLKLRQKYNLNINFDTFLMIAYYKKVEKRGFLIIDEITKKEITENTLILNKIF